MRSLWSRVEAVQSALRQERCVVESVLRGQEGHYVLDGRDLDLHIPLALLRRVEHLQLQVRTLSLGVCVCGHCVCVCVCVDALQCFLRAVLNIYVVLKSFILSLIPYS